MNSQRPEKRLILWIVVLCALILATLWVKRSGSHESLNGVHPTASGLAPDQQEMIQRVLDLEQERQAIENELWKEESEAKHHGRYFIELWNALKDSDHPMLLANQFAFGSLTYGSPAPTNSLAKSSRFNLNGSLIQHTTSSWTRQVTTWSEVGWKLMQSEWRHVGFTPASRNQGQAASTMEITAHLLNAFSKERMILKGPLEVQWSRSLANGRAHPIPQLIDASKLEMVVSSAEPSFVHRFTRHVVPFEKTFFIDPLIVKDLNGDGLSEIVLAARNLLLVNQGAFEFQTAPLCLTAPGPIFTGIIADFDVSGSPDFLCLDRQGLIFVPGNGTVPLEAAPKRVWTAPIPIQYGQVITAGDIDGDTDLDVWIGQYKLPFDKGQMPTPYFDALDGNPCYLLQNNGDGIFTDITTESGIGLKRQRRIYSSSFVDVDSDRDLDLVLVSDFAGLDVLINDGSGKFKDATADWVANPKAFGMAHLFVDFNNDQQVDVLMIGMNSPVADRLDRLGLGDPNFPEYTRQRAAMTYGNRFYVSDGSRFIAAPFSDELARTGWSWGTTAFDYDNDGDLDLYVANGHESEASVEDYERQFWLHDIYLGRSEDNAVLDLYFNFMSTQLRGAGMSYGGYEINRFFENHDNTRFTESAFFQDLAIQSDSRNVVSEDLDGDGKIDLIFTTWHVWPQMQQTLRVYQNVHPLTGNWIELLLVDSSSHNSIGAKVIVSTVSKKQTQWIVTGDSYRSQHSTRLHFGLGEETVAETVEIHWPSGMGPTLFRGLKANATYRIQGERISTLSSASENPSL